MKLDDFWQNMQESLREGWTATQTWLEQTSREEAERLQTQWQEFGQSFQQAWGNRGEGWQDWERHWEAGQKLLGWLSRFHWEQWQRASLPLEERHSQEASWHHRTAQELAEFCQAQGGAWVKAAQFLSCRADWLPPVYAEALASLQDQAPAVPWEALVPILEAELGPQWRDYLGEISPIPLATASIAQVHMATLPYGRKIVLKIQLPLARERFQADLQFFGWLARWLKPVFAPLDTEQIARELTQNLTRELDYYQEASHLTQFFTHYQAHPWEFPLLIPELSRARVLGLSFVEGTPLRHFLAEVPQAASPLLNQVLVSFVHQIFEVGFFHADPHPGNFFVTPRGALALLDFGAIGQLSDHQRQAYRQIILAFLLQNWDEVPKLMRFAGFAIEDPTALMERLQKASRDCSNPLLHLQDWLEIMRQSGIQLPDSFVLVARVLIVLGGLLRQYQIQPDLWQLSTVLHCAN